MFLTEAALGLCMLCLLCVLAVQISLSHRGNTREAHRLSLIKLGLSFSACAYLLHWRGVGQYTFGARPYLPGCRHCLSRLGLGRPLEAAAGAGRRRAFGLGERRQAGRVFAGASVGLTLHARQVLTMAEIEAHRPGGLRAVCGGPNRGRSPTRSGSSPPVTILCLSYSSPVISATRRMSMPRARRIKSLTIEP